MYLLTRLCLICALFFCLYVPALAAWLWPWAVFLVVVIALCCYRRPVALSAHGTATWADFRHVEEKKLLDGTSLAVGEIGDLPGFRLRTLFDKRIPHREACDAILGPAVRVATVRQNVMAHSTVVAPSGAGKGTCLIVPFLRSCPDSVVTADVKGGENAKLCAEYRREHFGQPQHLLDCLRVVTDKPATLNVLDWVEGIEDCQEIAAALVERKQEAGDAIYFLDKAVEILTAVIALVVASAPPENRSLQTVADIVSSPQKWAIALAEMMKSNAYDGMLARKGAALTHLRDRELGSALSTVQKCVSFLSLPAVGEATRSSSFCPDDVVKGKASVWLIATPNKAAVLAPLVRLQLGALLRACIKVNGLSEANKVHFVIDEAHQMGAGSMPEVAAALTVGRAYGIRLQLYLQNLGQLDKWPDNGKDLVLANTGQTFFGVNTLETAKYLSERLGSRTIAVGSGGTSDGTTSQGGSNGGNAGHSHSHTRSSNWGQHAEPLLRVDELFVLDPRTAVTVLPGVRPICTTLTPYYERSPRRKSVLKPLRDLIAAATILVFSAGLSIAVTEEVRRAGTTPAYRPVPGVSHGQTRGVDGGDGGGGGGGQGGNRGVPGRPRPTVGRR